ncbi:hypothetical protein Y1Q_0007190 [Alligator mississippiensis]|uniref:Chromodomain-helicase-DNA-binding protein 1-like C-terminal domain-containing protein n=1 Tax=Alligator mississippiensis TaxID=8496 RepID=A0A151N6K3_ALLMI|nr:hypothetical protein Y1Q_0007190 [Alligator mississippiensis]
MQASEGGGERLCQVQKTEEEYLLSNGNEATSSKCKSSIAPLGHSLIHYTDGLDQDSFKICKEFLRPFKKSLRKLDLPQDLPKDKKLKYTKKSLTILGDHINMFLQHYCKSWELKHWETMLWRFVSLFSELDAKQLRKLYKYSKNNQMAKFLKLYCSSENPDSDPLPENATLLKLYDAWGLHRDENNMQESRTESQSPQTSLHGDREAASITKSCCQTTSNSDRKRAADIYRTTRASTLDKTPRDTVPQKPRDLPYNPNFFKN